MNPLAVPGDREVANRTPGTDVIWRAPLVPLAVSATAGILLDRFAAVPLLASLIAVAVLLAAWTISHHRDAPGLSLAYLLAAVACAAAAYHHWYRNVHPVDDIAQHAASEGRPARLRGVLVEEPFTPYRPGIDPLRSLPSPPPTFAVVAATSLFGDDQWIGVTGRVRLIMQARPEGVRSGDQIEAVGRLLLPEGPANPGEPDERDWLADQRIRAILQVRHTTDAVTLHASGFSTSPSAWLATVRSIGQRRLADALPAEQSGLAMALLLGEATDLSGVDWDKYKRTGVVHLLVVSGQQLMVVGVFLWWILRLAGVRRRRSALLVTVILIGYALLTGGRPPVMRAAVTVAAGTVGVILGRVSMPANALALAWLVVAALNPTDMFTPGCQLSFLTVAILFWGTGRWLARPSLTPLQRQIEESRPAPIRWLRGMVGLAGYYYAVTLVIWLAAAPLVASQYHLISPVAVLIGPPLLLLMSIALIAGFLLLLASLVVPFLVPLLAWITASCLAVSEFIVDLADRLPGSHLYVGNLPTWWVMAFYGGLLAVLMLPQAQRQWRAAVASGLSWLAVGLLAGSISPATGELRCTFLAVGHGGCTVLETPDGRTILYDAGAINGPEVTRRHIAPFLWHRGIRRIDDILISHGDLDHFNGLPALLERFAVGQVTLTPTFADRANPAIRTVLGAIERHGIDVRIVQAGDRLRASNVEMHVLHPPAAGPPGKENYRSMVLRVSHRGHSILLTGDLEGVGLDQVLRMPAEPVDVLMAPHHGSKTANTPALARWARPKLVVSCEGRPRGPERPPQLYSAQGAYLLPTWPHGAVTVCSSAEGLQVETFRTGQRFWLRR